MPSSTMTEEEIAESEKVEGWVLNIERYTLHDGPGIRTTVFLKGCPLRCLWCSNPESQLSRPELIYFQDKCTACGHCLNVCPQDAIVQSAPGEPVTILWDRCDGCGACVDSCVYEALTIVGEKMTAVNVIDIVARDMPFYTHSGGGLTISGGEPFAQPEFASAVLRLAKERGIRTAIQSSGQAPLSSVKKLLPYLDLVIFDIKHLDSAAHKTLTGVPNEQILSNLSYINLTGTPIILQIPFIPGLNDSLENMEKIVDLVKSCGSVQGLSVLAYHTLGLTKYRCTGREYDLESLEKASNEYLEEKKAYFEEKGVPLIAFNG